MSVDVHMTDRTARAFKLGHHVLNYRRKPWVWYDGGGWDGPMCRTRVGCYVSHWWRHRAGVAV